MQELFGLPVISLTLVDPRYYHLDTALAVLDDSNVAYFPGAFSEGSRAAALRDHGYTPIGVDLSELLKAGGSAKCCTLELRA